MSELDKPKPFSEIQPGDIKQVGPVVLDRFRAFAEANEWNLDGVLPGLHERHTQGTSLTALGKEVGVFKSILSNIFGYYGYPVRSPRDGLVLVWQQAKEEQRKKLKDAWNKPGAKERRVANMRSTYDSDEYRAALSQGMKAAWRTQEYRDHILPPLRKHLDELRENPSTRKRMAEGTRRYVFKEENLTKQNTPTLRGQRNDIPFYSLSSWEANLARVIISSGRPYTVRSSSRLAVPPDIQTKYKVGEVTGWSIDFLIINEEGNLVAYELMAHPRETPIGLLKAQLFKDQYPSIELKLITSKAYYDMQRVWAPIINADPRFSGWETSKDNWKTNPDKYQHRP